MIKRKEIHHNGAYYNENMTTLYKVENNLEKSEFTVPEGVTRICAHAFENVPFKRIILPSSIKYIGNRAFAGIADYAEFICFMSNPQPYQENICFLGEDFIPHRSIHIPLGTKPFYEQSEWISFDTIECDAEKYKKPAG